MSTHSIIIISNLYWPLPYYIVIFVILSSFGSLRSNFQFPIPLTLSKTLDSKSFAPLSPVSVNQVEICSYVHYSCTHLLRPVTVTNFWVKEILNSVTLTTTEILVRSSCQTDHLPGRLRDPENPEICLNLRELRHFSTYRLFLVMIILSFIPPICIGGRVVFCGCLRLSWFRLRDRKNWIPEIFHSYYS